jgi:hypothetical protein
MGLETTPGLVVAGGILEYDFFVMNRISCASFATQARSDGYNQYTTTHYEYASLSVGN